MISNAAGAITLCGLATIFVEWLFPSTSRRAHHAWRLIGFTLASAGFTLWSLVDVTAGPLWHLPLDPFFAVADAWAAYDEYRKWRDSDDDRKRKRRAGARARALLDRMQAAMPKPREPLPAPT